MSVSENLATEDDFATFGFQFQDSVAIVKIHNKLPMSILRPDISVEIL